MVSVLRVMVMFVGLLSGLIMVDQSEVLIFGWGWASAVCLLTAWGLTVVYTSYDAQILRVERQRCAQLEAELSAWMEDFRRLDAALLQEMREHQQCALLYERQLRTTP